MKAMAYFRTWDGVRWFRLALAVIFLITGLVQGDALAFGLAAILGAQATFNIGCCGAACSTSPRSTEATADVSYEEIK